MRPSAAPSKGTGKCTGAASSTATGELPGANLAGIVKPVGNADGHFRTGRPPRNIGYSMMPPDTSITAPFRYDASSLARNA